MAFLHLEFLITYNINSQRTVNYVYSKIGGTKKKITEERQITFKCTFELWVFKTHQSSISSGLVKQRETNIIKQTHLHKINQFKVLLKI